MISINNNKMYSNLLIFKFKNYDFQQSEDIKAILKYSTNSGDFKELETINTLGQTDYKKIFVLGLGLAEEFNSVKLLKALAYAVRTLKNTITELDIMENFNEDFGVVIGQAVELALYKFSGIKKTEQKIKLENINIISQFDISINKGLIIGNSSNYARQLSSLPSNYVTPKYLAQQAELVAKEENLDVKLLDKFSMEQLGMNGILYVGKGSANAPYLIVLQYLGDEESKDITALIGKGITFDSGGITLKPGKGMENMVGDMAGAASVLAAMKAIACLKPKKNVIALIPAAENMPSSTAYKPGDVITTYSGKTVQVISTDAEGRLILCDAITYAKELGASTIIEVSTLTGACANFLGGINIGMLSNSNNLADNIIRCGKNVGENFWRFPNNPEYMEQLKTDSADLRNTGTDSGAIVAGLFLNSFAEDVNFAHLDIAGSSGSSKPNDLYDSGAFGVPTRTLIEYIMNS